MKKQLVLIVKLTTGLKILLSIRRTLSVWHKYISLFANTSIASICKIIELQYLNIEVLV